MAGCHALSGEREQQIDHVGLLERAVEGRVELLPLPAASPMGLRGVAVGADGTVYVADLRGRRLLALAPVGARRLPAAEQAPVNSPAVAR